MKVRQAGSLLMAKVSRLLEECRKDWVVAFTVATIVIRGLLSLLPVPVTWDEAVYANLAREYYYFGFHFYFPQQVILDFSRAPITPLSIYTLYLLTGPNHIVAQLVVYAYSVAAIYTVYLLGRDMYGERVGRFSALALACSPFLLVSSWGILSEPPCIFFSTLFLLLVYRAQRNPKYYVPAGVALTLTTLTRYPGFLVVLAALFMVVASGNTKKAFKSPWLYAGIGAALAAAAPWLAFSKSLTGSYTGFLQIFFASTQQWMRDPYIMLLGVTPLDYAVSASYDALSLVALPGALISYFLWGVKAGKGRAEGRALIFWLLSSVVAYGLLMRTARLVDYLRYNETALPAVAVLSAVGLAVLLGEGDIRLEAARSVLAGKKKVALMLIALNFAAGFAGAYVVRSEAAISESGVAIPVPVYEFLAVATPPDGSILSNIYPIVSYYTDRVCMWFPQVDWLREYTFTHLNVKYILFNLNRYCPIDTLIYVESHPEKFERILIYGGIILYRVK
ncbi:MAG: glycosyltransferase family 39 protein [Candidatus Jordarchaeales archaeon]|nr:glycosyltransferase family 39 protein [Candidatus Jordarchaeia archaeon]